MATATKKSRSARTVRSPVLKPGVPASTEFLICEENSGSYHWRIVADDGEILARSRGFASYGQAQQAAQHVRESTASAPVESGATPIDLAARRERRADDSDAERWLDEGGRS